MTTYSKDRCPSYSRAAFDLKKLKKVVKWAIAVAKKEKLGAIAGCGNSGLPVAAIVAYALKMPLIAVRKDFEGKWDRYNAVLPEGAVRYGFIDDLVATGRTLNTVKNAVAPSDGELVAVLAYYSPVSKRDLEYHGLPDAAAYSYPKLTPEEE